MRPALLDLFPNTARIDSAGRLLLGGCRVDDLAQDYGTPLYVFDEETLRGACRAYRDALSVCYPGLGHVTYAAKAYLCQELANVVDQEGLGLDVASGGEMFVARAAGFPMARIHLHGNNKSQAELQQALDWGVGRLVVDNLPELERLGILAAEAGKRARIWLRINPGIGAHTHEYVRTGVLDSKFGLPLGTGEAETAILRAMADPGLELVGLHAHIGSQILQTEPFQATADALLAFASEMRVRHGFALREFSPGGGLGIRYTLADEAVSTDQYVAAISQAVVRSCQCHHLPLPGLILEPGRSVVGRAGVALYSVGVRKEIPGVRTYISVDGGMADNIRPALYGAEYAALAATRANDAPMETVSVAGRYCESGDVLIRDTRLPRLAPGDLLAIPAAGAYCLSMASNYNLTLRPAVVMVGDGQARVMQRRETYQDLLRGSRAADDPEGR